LIVSPVKLFREEQEKLAFLQYNYCRFRYCSAVRVVNGSVIGVRDAIEVLFWLERAIALRELITRANVALVWAILKTVRVFDADYSELISEGDETLLRVIDRFDVSRGCRFATLAGTAIRNTMIRVSKKETNRRKHFPVGIEPYTQKSDHIERKREEVSRYLAGELRVVLKNELACLNPDEKFIIEKRFCFNRIWNAKPSAITPTLDQVGQKLGLTRERVRQIQDKALRKIGLMLEPKLQ
jgi:RNA polymerase sigma factor (sigma-70 family)